MVSGQMQVIQEKWQGWEKALREETAPKLRDAADQLGVFNCLCIRLLFERIDA